MYHMQHSLRECVQPCRQDPHSRRRSRSRQDSCRRSRTPRGRGTPRPPVRHPATRRTIYVCMDNMKAHVMKLVAGQLCRTPTCDAAPAPQAATPLSAAAAPDTSRSYGLQISFRKCRQFVTFQISYSQYSSGISHSGRKMSELQLGKWILARGQDPSFSTWPEELELPDSELWT
eukprot:9338035-Karenia_brevis.AAC.3